MKISSVWAHSITAICPILIIVIVLLFPPTQARISPSPLSVSNAASNRKVISAKLDIRSNGDPFLRITPDACVFDVFIDGRRLVDPQIPFCTERRGRAITVPELNTSPRVALDIVIEASTKGDLKFTPERSPWKILALGLLSLTFLCVSVPWYTRRTSASPAFALFPELWRTARALLLLLLATWTLLYLRYGGGTSLQVTGVVLFSLSTVWLWILRPPVITLQTGDNNRPAHLAWLILGMVITSFVLTVGVLSSIRHNDLGSFAFDLAIQENVLWNTTYGHPFISSVMGGIQYLGNHTVVAYALLLPFYFLIPSTHTLLWLQSLILGSTALPLFLLGKRVFSENFPALLIAISFLIHPAIIGAACYDFHELALAPCALAWVAYSVVTKRPILLGLATLLASCVKEDMSLNLLLLGIGFFASLDAIRGAYLIFVGIFSYFLWQIFIIPAFAGFESSYTWYLTKSFGDGATPIDVVIQLLEAPYNVIVPLLDLDRISFLFQTLGATLFIPLASFFGGTALSYGLALIALSTHSPLYQLGYHYVFAWLTLASISTILYLGAIRISISSRYVIVGAIFLAHLLLFLNYGPFFPRDVFRYGPSARVNPFQATTNPELVAATQWMKTYLAKESSIITTEHLAPHFANRARVAVIDRTNRQLAATFDYCIAPKRTPTSRCIEVGCDGTQVPIPFQALLLCKIKSS